MKMEEKRNEYYDMLRGPHDFSNIMDVILIVKQSKILILKNKYGKEQLNQEEEKILLDIFNKQK